MTEIWSFINIIKDIAITMCTNCLDANFGQILHSCTCIYRTRMILLNLYNIMNLCSLICNLYNFLWLQCPFFQFLVIPRGYICATEMLLICDRNVMCSSRGNNLFIKVRVRLRTIDVSPFPDLRKKESLVGLGLPFIWMIVYMLCYYFFSNEILFSNVCAC